MPTPFYHLSLAKVLLEHPALPEDMRAFLQKERAAFLFGNTAPDVQTISRQRREDTHFFEVPPNPDELPPWLLILKHHKELSISELLPSAQAAFLAGYLCHIQADLLWVNAIFLPVFARQRSWATFSRRLYLHNVLRSYLDHDIMPSLSNGITQSLKQAEPMGWLPFVHDSYLYHWRNYLTEQLEPGAAIKTVEVFAARQGIPVDEYYHLLASEKRMEEEIFSHLPGGLLESYRQHLIDENLWLIQNYLEPGECQAD